MLDLLEEFRSALSALDTREIDYAVCGGLAVAIHVRPRATLDIDLLVPRGSLEPAKDGLRGLGYTIEAGRSSTCARSRPRSTPRGRAANVCAGSMASCVSSPAEVSWR